MNLIMHVIAYYTDTHVYIFVQIFLSSLDFLSPLDSKSGHCCDPSTYNGD